MEKQNLGKFKNQRLEYFNLFKIHFYEITGIQQSYSK